MRITGRERTFVIGGACLLGALLVFQLVLYPSIKRTGELERLIPRKERDLREIRLLRKEYDSLKEMRASMAQKIPASERALSPLSKLDGMIERSNLRQSIRSIKPSTSTGVGGGTVTVEVSMEKVDLPQITRFLYVAQSSHGGFRIARLAIKPRYTTPRYLDVNLQMVFYQG
jgi:type II secretory pathway component PulM